MRARTRLVHAAARALVGLAASGCTVLSPQLDPPDIAALEQVADRDERERLYADLMIVRHAEPQGVRYTRGSHPLSVKRSWHSLDAILRSDANASEALPTRTIRTSRVLTALTAISALAVVSGVAVSAREGLDLKRIGSTGAMLLAGGVATLSFGIGAGITFNRARKVYDAAVDVYNESLGMRLGIYDAAGNYRPPAGVLVDSEGYILLGDDGGPLPPVSAGRVPRPAAEPSLPPALTAEDAGDAIADAQARAITACGALATPGALVELTVTVSGATGEVLAVESPATPLAECVAAEVQRARFPRFAAPSQVIAAQIRF